MPPPVPNQTGRKKCGRRRCWRRSCWCHLILLIQTRSETKSAGRRWKDCPAVNHRRLTYLLITSCSLERPNDHASQNNILLIAIMASGPLFLQRPPCRVNSTKVSRFFTFLIANTGLLSYSQIFSSFICLQVFTARCYRLYADVCPSVCPLGIVISQVCIYILRQEIL